MQERYVEKTTVQHEYGALLSRRKVWNGNKGDDVEILPSPCRRFPVRHVIEVSCVGQAGSFKREGTCVGEV